VHIAWVYGDFSATPYYGLHFTFITIARGKNKIWGVKLHTSNLNTQRRYNAVMNV
jgi:hypothetical protein